MAVQRIMFVGGKVLTDPTPLKLKRGGEVIFTMEEDPSFASVTLSFQSPSPFDPSEITVRPGAQATLIVKRNVPKTKVRFVATPQLKEPNPPPPIEVPPIVVPPIEVPPIVAPPIEVPPIVAPPEKPPIIIVKDPPGTVSGELDVTPDSPN